MRTLLTRIRWLTQRRRTEAKMPAELELHLEHKAEETKAGGLAEHEAALAVRRDHRGFVQEETRDAWGWTWIDQAGQDIRYAGRLLRRRPALSATAILTLMLGVGGTTAVFSLIDALLMRDLPVEGPEELVRLVERRPDGTTLEAFTLATHDTLQRGSKALSGVIGSSQLFGRPADIEVGGERRSAFVQLVSDNYFDVLGVRVFRGRVFHQPEPGTPGEPIAVISDEYWRRQYSTDVSVLGTRFRRGSREFTIAGIAPPGFRGTEIDIPVDIWVSIEQVVPANADERTRGRWVMGRLQPGVTPAQAEAESASMGTPLIAGREFMPSDDERAPLVAIVNESFARRFLAGKDPIGTRFFREGGSRAGELMQIVGVVKDSKWVNLRDDSSAMYYRPYRQMGGTPVVRLAVRTSGDPEPVSRDLLRVAQSIDRRIALSNVVPFREIVNRTLVVERLVAQVFTGFGMLALLIAAVGLYGVLAYSVARRRREIGLRIAVGAQPATIEIMFLTESLTLVALGIAIGIPVAIVVTRVVSSMLFGLSPQDPASIGAALAALTLVTVAAAYLPARTAARTDPLFALREE